SNCLHAFAVAPDGMYSADTGNFSDARTTQCAGGAARAPDVFYRMDLGETARDLILDVIVDEAAEAPYDAVLSARARCGEITSELGCSNSGWGEHLELLDVSGELTVLVDGTSQFGGAASGAFTLHARTRTISAIDQLCDATSTSSRCELGARCVAGVCAEDSPELACQQAIDITAEVHTGGFDTVAATFPFASDHRQSSCAFNPVVGSGEDLYRIELTESGDLVATTDFAETRFDTVLSLRSADCTGELACHDDVDLGANNVRSTLVVTALTPGVYVLAVDGSSAPGTGAYRLRVTVDPI
ncbi:MAG: hypothetical protein AAGC55_13635, partial [Myxococcota bacterium]